MATIADLNTLTRFLSDTDTTSLTAANLLILINKSYERITGRLLSETGNGKWPHGDVNYTAFPTYAMNLVNSQAEYQIDSLTGVLSIMGVEAMDKDGNYYPLEPITFQEIRRQGIAQTEFHETDGKPLYYEKRENIIVLYPAPDNGVNVTLTNGLKIFYLRGADIYTSAQVTTGTKEPGFPSPWHDILAYEAAMDYCALYKPERVNYLSSQLAKKERELLDFVSRRNQDDKKVLRMRGISYE